MKNATLKLQGRPTLTRGQHKSERKLYVEMTFALVWPTGSRKVVATARGVTERTERERATAAQSNVPLRLIACGQSASHAHLTKVKASLGRGV